MSKVYPHVRIHIATDSFLSHHPPGTVTYNTYCTIVDLKIFGRVLSSLVRSRHSYLCDYSFSSCP